MLAHQKFIIGILLLIALPSSAEEDVQAIRILQQRYQAMQQANAAIVADTLILNSDFKHDRLSSDGVGLINFPLHRVIDALSQASHWCDFMLLTLNIKSCTHEIERGVNYLTFYAGRKYYQPPEDSEQLRYRFEIEKKGANYFRIRLSAAEGPYGTSDYVIMLEGMTYAQASLLRIYTAYTTSFWSRTGTRLYLSTLGAGKVGFSMQGYTDGKPEYIDGLRGIVERNAMRYYLALKTFIETQGQPDDILFESRLSSWFDATEKFKLQLHELDKDEYVEFKRRELLNQRHLQKLLDTK